MTLIHLNVLKTPNEGYAVVDAELRFTGIMQEDSHRQ